MIFVNSFLNIFVLGVPVVKVAQVDNCHDMYLHIVFSGRIVGNNTEDGGSRPASWNCLSQSQANKNGDLEIRCFKTAIPSLVNVWACE